MILRYPGGKSKKSIQKRLRSFFPKRFTEFRDSFAGGLGVFYGLELETAQIRWINDLNKGLMSLYLALRDRPDEFIALCRTIEPPLPDEPLLPSRSNSKKSKGYNARLKQVFDSLKYDETCDQALRYFFINRTVWMGRVIYDKNFESRMYFSNPSGWNIVKTDKLHKASSWLQGAKITCLDYREVLAADGEDCWIYADPPYVVNTNLSSKSKLYEHNFTLKDHKEFVEACKECKHNICISYDDDPDGLVRSWFREEDGFYIHEAEWKYCGTASPKGSNKVKKSGKELIITNYSLDVLKERSNIFGSSKN